MPAKTSTGQARSPEIIAVCSGKGGTGKTVIAACLGYALASTGHPTLYVDTDTATDGLSLFLLGPEGADQQRHISPEHTFQSIIGDAPEKDDVHFKVLSINRSGKDDHGISHDAIISGKALYGDFEDTADGQLGFRGSKSEFRSAVRRLFNQLRGSGQYEYIVVDTRGGFGYETTEVCALADSFIVVTEPQYTSFYQDRNLIGRISSASTRNGTRPLLRGFIVNKSTDPREWSGEMDLEKVESSFRLTLTNEFPVRFQETHPIPLDVDAQIAYKSQKIPLRDAPASYFSFALLTAFRQLLTVVTAAWTDDQAAQWNGLVDRISDATAERNRLEEEGQAVLDAQEKERKALRERVSELEREVSDARQQLEETKGRFEREISRSDALLQQTANLETKAAPAAVPAPETVAASATGPASESSLEMAEAESPSRPASVGIATRSRRLSANRKLLAGLVGLAVLSALVLAVFLLITSAPEEIFVTCSVAPSVVDVGGTADITVDVANLDGEPIELAEARLTVPLGSLSESSAVGGASGTTDRDGRVEFPWWAPGETFSGSTSVEFAVSVSGADIEDGTTKCSAQLQGTR